MRIVAASWPVDSPAWAIDKPAASDIARFFGLIADRAAPMPNDRTGVNWSIDFSHFGITGSSPGFGRARHWRTAPKSSSSPSSSLMMLTVFVGPLLAEKLLPPARTTARVEISARPKTNPAANAVPFVLALGVTSIRIIAMIGTTLIAAPSAYGRISPMALPTAHTPLEQKIRAPLGCAHYVPHAHASSFRSDDNIPRALVVQIAGGLAGARRLTSHDPPHA